MQPTAVCQSLSHRRTHAEAHAHAHTSAGVAGAPRVFKACTQSGVRVRAGAHVCVSVVLRVCSGCARVRMCVPRLGAFHARWDADLRAIARLLSATLPISVYYLRVFRGLGLDKRNCHHLRGDRNHQRGLGDELYLTLRDCETCKLRPKTASTWFPSIGTCMRTA